MTHATGVPVPPARPWTVGMQWRDLLMLHWRLEPARLQTYLPQGLELDLRDGQAWISLIAFRMSHVRLRWGFGLPGATAFPELNLRTYVLANGQPAIWFFSLDAGSRPMVALLRRWYRLPYLYAKASVGEGAAFDASSDASSDASPEAASDVRYGFTRQDRRAPAARFDATARPDGPAAAAPDGSLDWFLAERYVLATHDAAGRLRLGHVRHAPYPLQAASCEVRANTLLEAWPELDPLGPDRASFAAHLDVRAWTLERARSGAAVSPTPGKG